MTDQPLIATGEVRPEFGDRLVEAVEVANQSSLVVVAGLAAIGELLVDRGEDGIVESPCDDRAFPGLEVAGERSDRTVLDLGRGREMVGHARVERVLAGDVRNEVACVMGCLGVQGQVALDRILTPWPAASGRAVVTSC